MKQVIGLFMVIFCCGTMVFAQDNTTERRSSRSMRVERDSTSLSKRMIADLNLDEKQAADFKKLQENYAAQMNAEREVMKAEQERRQIKMVAIREAHNAEVKKILTEEQYAKYILRNQRSFAANRDFNKRSSRFMGENRHRNGQQRRMIDEGRE